MLSKSWSIETGNVFQHENVRKIKVIEKLNRRGRKPPSILLGKTLCPGNARAHNYIILIYCRNVPKKYIFLDRPTCLHAGFQERKTLRSIGPLIQCKCIFHRYALGICCQWYFQRVCDKETCKG